MPARPPLPTPHPALKVSVVVPARNEEALVGSCLEALAEQEGVSPEEYEVLLVLDRCTDETEPRAREIADAHPRFRLHFLDGPGKGSGHARRMGMELASARLLGLRRPKGLIASTDADTVVAPDWLAAQLRAVSRGALAVGDASSSPRTPPYRRVSFAGTPSGAVADMKASSPSPSTWAKPNIGSSVAPPSP